MKKVALACAFLMLISTTVFATAFSPEPLKISAQSAIQYNFDGSALNIPVTITGTPSSTLFCVFTKDQKATIKNVTNGFLGWHTVNLIDTCIYLSDMIQLEKGTTNIQWDGKDDDGGVVAKGSYTYYIWGFDNVTPRIQCTKWLKISPWAPRTILTTDLAGAKLIQPIIYTGTDNRSPTRTTAQNINNYKWVIGSDPTDSLSLETCTTSQISSGGGLAFDPADRSNFFFTDKIENGIQISKLTWVPNGASVMTANDQKWGENGKFFYPTTHAGNGYWGPGTVTDGTYLWAVNADAYSANTTISELIYLDVNDGTEIKRFDLAKWWVDTQDGANKGQTTGGPAEIDLRNGVLYFGSHSSCVNQCFNPYYEDDSEANLWVNGNGDIVGDHNYEVGDDNAWVCNDYVPGAYKYNVSADGNGFMLFPSYNIGATSFGLYIPDGTAAGYMALAGETAFQKYGAHFIDYGSAYDGIYTTNNMGRTTNSIDNSVWWVGQDSITGTISFEVGVADAAPGAFVVAQNTPNPFNPTTTISFSLAKAGKTTVEVFNVAGQKVGTLANGTMSAGSHSVTWNASKFSAGVYFYTVKSGSFSKTMKMTLLK